MRLDKYLKVARIIKRRTVANEACDAAHVTVNGKPAKASYEVREGDVLEITFGARTLRIAAYAEQVSPAPRTGTWRPPCLQFP